MYIKSFFIQFIMFNIFFTGDFVRWMLKFKRKIFISEPVTTGNHR